MVAALLFACALAVLDVPGLVRQPTLGVASTRQPTLGVASTRRALTHRHQEQQRATHVTTSDDRQTTSYDRMGFPYNMLHHWAPQPNNAAFLADGVLVLVALCIFLPAFLAMRSICAISRPLDMMANAFTRHYIGQAQRARRVHRLQRRPLAAGGLR